MSLGVGPEEMKDPSDRLAAPEIDLRPSIYIYQYHVMTSGYPSVAASS